MLKIACCTINTPTHFVQCTHFLHKHTCKNACAQGHTHKYRPRQGKNFQEAEVAIALLRVALGMWVHTPECGGNAVISHSSSIRAHLRLFAIPVLYTSLLSTERTCSYMCAHMATFVHSYELHVYICVCTYTNTLWADLPEVGDGMIKRALRCYVTRPVGVHINLERAREEEIYALTFEFILTLP